MKLYSCITFTDVWSLTDVWPFKTSWWNVVKSIFLHQFHFILAVHAFVMPSVDLILSYIYIFLVSLILSYRFMLLYFPLYFVFYFTDIYLGIVLWWFDFFLTDIYAFTLNSDDYLTMLIYAFVLSSVDMILAYKYMPV